MNIIKLPLSFFVERLEAKEPFTYVRYGDGELQCILGKQGRNCDGTEYTNDLMLALRKTLEHPRDYLYAIGPKVTAKKNRVSEQALVYLETKSKVKCWHDSETILNASLAEELKPLVDVLRKRKLMIVGEGHLQRLPMDMLFIESAGAPNKYFHLYEEIMRGAHRCEVILFSAGMTSKVLIHECYSALGMTHTLLDIGSTWDMYCEKFSRGYARRMNAVEIERLRELNFGSKGQ